MYLVLAIAMAPVAFCVLTWTAVTAYRICFPERDRPYAESAVARRAQAVARGQMLPVGAFEIRADQRRRCRHLAEASYSFGCGLPTAWIEDLQERRN